MLQQIGSSRECILYALLQSFADEQGSVQMSQNYMMHRLFCSEREVRYSIALLLDAGYISIVQEGRGKGITTKYELHLKRVQNCTLIDEQKGYKNVSLSDTKRVQKCILKKGTKLSPNNNSFNNNNAAIAANAPAHAGDLENGFSKFWELFQPAAEYQDRQRACREQWGKMDETTRSTILQELSISKPNRANPLFYLLYYGEQPTTPVKLTMYEVYKRYNTTEPAGYCILAEHDMNGAAYWCKTEDAKRAGWQIQREFN